MALIVQRDLAEIGVDMQIESVPFDGLQSTDTARDFDAVMIEFIVGNSRESAVYILASQSTQNVWGYQNPSLDQALDGSRRASDDTIVSGARSDGFNEQALNDPPAIFLALGQITRAPSASDSRWSRRRTRIFCHTFPIGSCQNASGETAH